ncbi:MAG: DUF2490 domain-containing protein [Polyangiaceae bacterium]|nr:DUF2490 domain-containing protein [Polyangiaceae bacterium]
MSKLFRAILIFAVSHSSLARAQTTQENQLWVASALTAPIASKSDKAGLGVWLDLHLRRGSDRTVGIVRPALGYRFSSAWSLWGGYAWIPTLVDNASDFSEHRLWQQAIFQTHAKPFRFQVRPRFEQRFHTGQGDVGFRARLFVRANLRFIEDLPLDLALWNEVFFGFNDTAWGQLAGFDQNRVFMGPAWTVGAVRFEVGYLNVLANRGNGACAIQHNAAAWAVLSF